MLFRGTPTFSSAHNLALALERFGGTLFAATHTDFGLMTLSVPPENFEDAFQLFAEIATHPTFADVEVERGIIREEILESLDDEGHQIDPDNLSRALMFGTHPLGQTIVGSLETIEDIGVADLRRHHQVHYTAANSVLCCAGAIDPDLCLQMARSHLLAMPAGDLVSTVRAPRQQKHPRFRFVENPTSQTDLRLAFRAPGARDPDEPATELLLRVLDDGMSTRLYAQVCDEKGLCYDVSAGYETHEDDGVFDLAAVVQHSRAPLVMRELCAIVSDLARHGPSVQELDKAKCRHRWETRRILDDADALAEFHGLASLTGTADTLDGRHKQIEVVSEDQVRHAARRLFRPENLSAVAVGLLEEPDRRKVEQLVRQFAVAD